MLELLVMGGPVMVPLLLCSILAVAVSLERIWYFFRTRVDSEDLMEEIKLAVQQGKILEAVQIAKRTPGPVAALLAAGVAYHDRPREEIKERLEEVGREELFNMERRLVVLETVTAVAPLLGLLGTVTGIIRTFQILGTVQVIQSPAQISVGIAEALLTTAAGLVIAIPTLAVHNWLVNIIERRVADMNRRAGELLDLLEAEGRF